MSNAAPKVKLHNRCKGSTKIKYTTSKQGPDHQPIFTCEVQVNGTTWGTGVGESKKDAENAAAVDAVRYGEESGAFNTL